MSYLIPNLNGEGDPEMSDDFESHHVCCLWVESAIKDGTLSRCTLRQFYQRFAVANSFSITCSLCRIEYSVCDYFAHLAHVFAQLFQTGFMRFTCRQHDVVACDCIGLDRRSNNFEDINMQFYLFGRYTGATVVAYQLREMVISDGSYTRDQCNGVEM